MLASVRIAQLNNDVELVGISGLLALLGARPYGLDLDYKVTGLLDITERLMKPFLPLGMHNLLLSVRTGLTLPANKNSSAYARSPQATLDNFKLLVTAISTVKDWGHGVGNLDLDRIATLLIKAKCICATLKSRLGETAKKK